MDVILLCVIIVTLGLLVVLSIWGYIATIAAWIKLDE